MILRRVDDIRGSGGPWGRLGCSSEGAQFRILWEGGPDSGGEVRMKESGGAGVRSGVDEGCCGRWGGGSKKLER